MSSNAFQAQQVELTSRWASSTSQLLSGEATLGAELVGPPHVLSKSALRVRHRHPTSSPTLFVRTVTGLLSPLRAAQARRPKHAAEEQGAGSGKDVDSRCPEGLGHPAGLVTTDETGRRLRHGSSASHTETLRRTSVRVTHLLC